MGFTNWLKDLFEGEEPKEDKKKSVTIDEYLRERNKQEREERKKTKEFKERGVKLLCKGTITYNFSTRKADKFKVKFEIRDRGIINTEVIGVKNIAGMSSLSKEQKQKIIDEIGKIKSEEYNLKKEIKITFDGKSNIKREHWIDDPELYGYKFDD
ncbi:MAG: hypothetical protein KC516_00740 [Nanoarchaeota archaeon]|nr:hypothetical protein [Nanoarchaeota archaeon]